VLAVEPAAAMVIGANIGTTSTAVIAVIGATPNARRMAAAHVLFNLITGVVALMLLPVLLAVLHRLAAHVSPETGAPLLLALFHTSFNLLGVMLLWPFTDRLVRGLEGWFRPREGDAARPRYLDANVAATPVLALQALTLELAHIGSIVARVARAVLDGSAQPVQVGRDADAIAQLIDAVGAFTALMRRAVLPERLAGILPHAIGISRYYRDSVDLAQAVQRLDPAAVPPELAEAATHFRAEAAALADASVAEPFDAAATGERMQSLARQYQELKSQALSAGSLGHLPVRQVVEMVEAFKDIERLADHLLKAARMLADMRAAAADRGPGQGQGGD
jgi:phosphate:Na+ symporter